jgi:hypothetical protein
MSNEAAKLLIEYCQANGRICPLPDRWNQLWEMLPEKQRDASGWIPPLPLILGAWPEPALLKMLRLEEHLRWACDHEVLNKVDQFLRSLSEIEWFHVGD